MDRTSRWPRSSSAPSSTRRCRFSRSSSSTRSRSSRTAEQDLEEFRVTTITPALGSLRHRAGAPGHARPGVRQLLQHEDPARADPPRPSSVAGGAQALRRGRRGSHRGAGGDSGGRSSRPSSAASSTTWSTRGRSSACSGTGTRTTIRRSRSCSRRSSPSRQRAIPQVVERDHLDELAHAGAATYRAGSTRPPRSWRRSRPRTIEEGRLERRVHDHREPLQRATQPGGDRPTRRGELDPRRAHPRPGTGPHAADRRQTTAVRGGDLLRLPWAPPSAARSCWTGPTPGSATLRTSAGRSAWTSWAASRASRAGAARGVSSTRLRLWRRSASFGST